MGFDGIFRNGVTIDANGRVIHRGDLGIRANVTGPFGPFDGSGKNDADGKPNGVPSKPSGGAFQKGPFAGAGARSRFGGIAKF